MARPRIFISSTYYDLRYVRNDLERFISQLCYEPVLNERGNIPYGRSEKLEQYCYREISSCDIVVHIVGGRLGSGSEQGPYSISQMELKTAHELHKQVYVFVENPVYVEYGTYLRNENNPSFVPQYVNDVQIYKFLKEVYNYPVNNVISSFESVNDIIHFLREQWAGLFQRYLQDDSRREDYKISSNLKSTSEMLARIIEYTTKERDETIKSILVGAHPIFNQLAEAAQIHFRVFFTNKNELDKLLAAFEFEEVFPPEDESKLVYVRQLSNAFETLEIEKDIFDVSGNLTPLEHNKWNSKLVSITAEDCYQYDDDIPF